MQAIFTRGVAWSVCVLVTTVNPAKMAEPIAKPFAAQTRVSHVLDESSDPQREWAHVLDTP